MTRGRQFSEYSRANAHIKTHSGYDSMHKIWTKESWQNPRIDRGVGHDVLGLYGLYHCVYLDILSFLSYRVQLSIAVFLFFCLLPWGMNMIEQKQTTEATSFLGFRDTDVRLFGRQNLLRHRVNLTSYRIFLLSKTLKMISLIEGRILKQNDSV